MPQADPESPPDKKRLAPVDPKLYPLVGLLAILMLGIIGSAFYLLQQSNAGADASAQARLAHEDVDALTPLEARFKLNEILEQAIAAQGGRLFVERLSTIRKLGVLTQDGVDMEVNYAFKRPNRIRYRIETQDQGFRVGYDGSQAWLQPIFGDSPGVAQPLVDEDASSLVLTSEIAAPAVLFFNEAQYMTLTGTEEVEGHMCYVLSYESPLRPAQIFFLDTESFLLRKRVRHSRFRGDDPTYVEVIFSDFRTLDGLQDIRLPYHEAVYFDGVLQTSFAINEIHINPGILDEFFRMPTRL